jgi:hypothetical protein
VALLARGKLAAAAITMLYAFVSASSSGAATVSGTLRDGYGTAVSNAQLTFQTVNGGAFAQSDLLGHFQFTAPIGAGSLRASWTYQPPPDSGGGPIPPQVRAPSTWNYTAPFSVAGDTALDLALPQAIQLTVRVTETDGRPVPGAWVSMSGTDSLARFEQFLADPGTGHCQPAGAAADSQGVVRLVIFPEARIDVLSAQQTLPPPLGTSRTARVERFTALQDTAVSLELPPLTDASVGPAVSHLALAFANPVRGPLMLAIEVPRLSRTDLRVIDLQGRIVARIVNALLAPGRYQVAWDLSGMGGQLPTGVYFIALHDGVEHLAKRLILLR